MKDDRQQKMKNQFTLGIGTYTHHGSRGIYGLTLQSDGRFSGDFQLLAEQESPSYFCVNQEKTVLYAVSEPQEGAGILCAYKICGGLQRFSERQSAGGPLCHIMMPPAQDRVLVCSYEDATVQVYPLNAEQGLEKLFCLRRHIGKGTVAGRQDKAHIHSAVLTPDGKYVIVCDLGTDQLVVYYMDRDSTKLRLEREKTVCLPQGTGPRHMVFHPNGRWAYLAGELSSRILMFEYSLTQGFSLKQQVDTCREKACPNLAAAIRITRDGRDVYVSNRGEDTLAHFRVDKNGRLQWRENYPTWGRTPRDFIMAADDRYLICANQDTDNLVSFQRDPDTGGLRLIEEKRGIADPVCLALW